MKKKIFPLLLAGMLIVAFSASAALSYGDVQETQGNVVINSFLPLDPSADQTVPAGTALSDLGLPDQLAIPGDDPAQPAYVPVTGWNSDPAYDPDTAGTYLFTPTLADGYILADGVDLPVIAITVADPGAPAAPAPNPPAASIQPAAPASAPKAAAPAAATVTVSDFAGLQAALSSVNNGGTIKITAGFAITDTLMLPAKKTITITSQGGPYTLTRDSGAGENLLEVPEGSTLTISHLILDGSGGTPSGQSSLVCNNGTFTLAAGGVLTHDAIGISGGDSDSILDGGSVSKNIYGVWVSCFEMDSGSVTGNSSDGVVIDSEGEFDFSGGSVSGNGNNGIYASAESMIVMFGGSVSGNGSNGIYAGKYSMIFMAGGSIKGNDDNGALLEKALMLMARGAISHNGADGVLVSRDSGLAMYGGTISHNAAYGVYLSKGGMLALGGSPKITGSDGLYYEKNGSIYLDPLSARANIQISDLPSYKAPYVVVAKSGGGGYKITKKDVAKFHLNNTAYHLELDQKHNRIIATNQKNGDWNSPATGDTSNMTPWIILGALALVVCVVLIVAGLRKKKK